jgi:hypothetical protein
MRAQHKGRVVVRSGEFREVTVVGLQQRGCTRSRGLQGQQ